MFSELREVQEDEEAWERFKGYCIIVPLIFMLGIAVGYLIK